MGGGDIYLNQWESPFKFFIDFGKFYFYMNVYLQKYLEYL